MKIRPKRRASRVRLTSGVLRKTVERLGAGQRAPRGIDVVGNRVRVEVLHTLSFAGIERVVRRMGGTHIRPAGKRMVEALVPFSRLVRLERLTVVTSVRPPVRVSVPVEHRAAIRPASFIPAAVAGEEVAKTNAATWHAAGQIGNGASVGIIDSFSGAKWTAAQNAGEVPAPKGGFCIVNGSSCNVWGGGDHGVAVAEVVHEMAPGASLYVATACCAAADLQAAVNYFASQGVDVITRSQTSEYDGPGNGTAGTADVIQDAVNKGMVWINSAGNSAGDPPTRAGQYWRGPWTDVNANGFLEFSGGDEVFAFICNSTGMLLNGLRWNDWGEPLTRTDYDAYVYESFDGVTLSGLQDQGDANQPGGAPPIEYFRSLNCSSPNDVDYLIVQRFGGAASTGDVLELMGNRTAFEYSQNPYSASGPASDTASVGGLSVGAIDPVSGVTLAWYSSRGPTNDGRIKPDLSAASCMRSFTYAPGCFNGTSAATPVVAGAAALALGLTPGATPAQVKTFLLGATQDRGAPGPDNDYGVGELTLPALSAQPPPPPPPPPADTTPPADPAITSPSHRIGVASRNRTVQFRWSGATDSQSGVDGFSVSLDTAPTTVPDTVKDAEEDVAGVDTVALPNGSYYLHLRTRDNAGNWSSGRHFGPVVISVRRGPAVTNRCVVPNVRGRTVKQARARLARARCGLGRVTRAYSGRVGKGRIIRQSRRAGARLPVGTRVNVVVSRGRRR